MVLGLVAASCSISAVAIAQVGGGSAAGEDQASAAAAKPQCGAGAAIVGTNGNDVGDDAIVGTPGADVIAGLGGNDLIFGLGGNDVICGGNGSDQIVGGGGNDRIVGRKGGDSLFGQGGGDRLSGGGGTDSCRGGSGKNKLRGCEKPAGKPPAIPPGAGGGDNSPPDAVNDTSSTDEDSSLSIAVRSNDTDPDSDPLNVSAVSAAGATGAVSVAGGGTAVNYDPSGRFDNLGAGQQVTDTFSYTVSDGSATDTAQVTITVTGNDDPPSALDDSATLTEDDSATAVAVLDNDTDVDGGDITIESKTDGSNGTVLITGGGSGLTYLPNPNFCGSDSFTYTLNGGSTAAVAVTVTCVDDNGTAVNDTAAVDEDSGTTTINVLANDTDNDGGSVVSVTQPPNGTAAITGGGTGVSYTPDADYCNTSLPTDDFTYTVPGGSTATVAVTVNCLNENPVAVDNAFSVSEDASLNVLAPGVLGNDTDGDPGDTLTVGEVNNSAANVGNPVTTTQGATVTLYADGSFGYDPTGAPALQAIPAGGQLNDTFTYKAKDTANALSGNATVTITVNGANDPLVAVDDSNSTSEDSVLNVNAPGVLGNDTDPDTGDPKSVTEVNGSGASVGNPIPTVQGATVTLNADGSYSYDPTGAAAFQALPVGSQLNDTFTYKASDGPTSDTATVTITVNGANDVPDAVDDNTSTDEDTVLNVPAAGVLTNDTDVDTGDTLAVDQVNGSGGNVGTAATTALGATVTLNADGSYSYDPTGSATLQSVPAAGSTNDAFTYRASDGNGGFDTATVTITVGGLNDPPNADDDTGSTTENSILNASAPGVLTNDDDVDTGDTLTVTEVNGSGANVGNPQTTGQGATVTLNADGSYSYDPTGSATLKCAGRGRDCQ